MSCECTYNRSTQELERICLYHLPWLQIIDAARPVFEELHDCDPRIREWLFMAKDLPRSAEFPLARVPQKSAARVKR